MKLSPPEHPPTLQTPRCSTSIHYHRSSRSHPPLTLPSSYPSTLLLPLPPAPPHSSTIDWHSRQTAKEAYVMFFSSHPLLLPWMPLPLRHITLPAPLLPLTPPTIPRCSPTVLYPLPSSPYMPFTSPTAHPALQLLMPACTGTCTCCTLSATVSTPPTWTWKADGEMPWSETR